MLRSFYFSAQFNHRIKQISTVLKTHNRGMKIRNQLMKKSPNQLSSRVSRCVQDHRFTKSKFFSQDVKMVDTKFSERASDESLLNEVVTLCEDNKLNNVPLPDIPDLLYNISKVHHMIPDSHHADIVKFVFALLLDKNQLLNEENSTLALECIAQVIHVQSL